MSTSFRFEAFVTSCRDTFVFAVLCAVPCKCTTCFCVFELPVGCCLFRPFLSALRCELHCSAVVISSFDLVHSDVVVGAQNRLRSDAAHVAHSVYAMAPEKRTMLHPEAAGVGRATVLPGGKSDLGETIQGRRTFGFTTHVSLSEALDMRQAGDDALSRRVDQTGSERTKKSEPLGCSSRWDNAPSCDGFREGAVDRGSSVPPSSRPRRTRYQILSTRPSRTRTPNRCQTL